MKIPIQKVDIFDQINSIDEAADVYNTLYQNRIVQGPMATQVRGQSHSITPEVEFWGHCSNLQAWVECDYDTRVLHSNIAFPLLKKLTQVGDLKAKRVFKEEIAKRFSTNYSSVCSFLINGNYLSYLNREELDLLLTSVSDLDILKNIADSFERRNTRSNTRKAIEIYKRIINIEPENIESMSKLAYFYKIKRRYKKAIEMCVQALKVTLNNFNIWKNLIEICFIEEKHDFLIKIYRENEDFNIKERVLNHIIPYYHRKKISKIFDFLINELKKENIKHATFNKKIYRNNTQFLELCSEEMKDISEIKGLRNLYDLSVLNLFNNKIREIKELGTLKKLNCLNLSSNYITEIKGLKNCTELRILDFSNNNLEKISGLDSLLNIRKLHLEGNNISEIRGLSTLKNLEELWLSRNKITEIKGLKHLSNLKSLYLNDNEISEIKGLEALVNLEELDLRGNKIEEIKGLKNLTKLSKIWLNDNRVLSIKELELLEQFPTAFENIDFCLNPIKHINGAKNFLLAHRNGQPIKPTGLWSSSDEIFNVSVTMSPIYNIGIKLYPKELKYIIIEGVKKRKVIILPLPSYNSPYLKSLLEKNQIFEKQYFIVISALKNADLSQIHTCLNDYKALLFLWLINLNHFNKLPLIENKIQHLIDKLNKIEEKRSSIKMTSFWLSKEIILELKIILNDFSSINPDLNHAFLTIEDNLIISKILRSPKNISGNLDEFSDIYNSLYQSTKKNFWLERETSIENILIVCEDSYSFVSRIKKILLITEFRKKRQKLSSVRLNLHYFLKKIGDLLNPELK